jgi:hypothetical protein
MMFLDTSNLPGWERQNQKMEAKRFKDIDREGLKI